MEHINAKCVYTNEWDKYARTTYEIWHDDEVDGRDIRVVKSHEIPEHDILCAGFPCQPFSLAGVSKKNSLGRGHGFQDAHQGNLFLEIARIASARKTPVLFLENVKNLLGHDQGRTWLIITEILDRLGYDVHYKVIDASEYVPQARKRIYIVAFRREYFLAKDIARFTFPHKKDRELPHLDSILDSDPDSSLMLTNNLWQYLQDYAEKHRAQGNGFGFGIAPRDGSSRTLSARYYKDGAEILIRESGWKNPRKLSVEESTRLMGFSGPYSLDQDRKFLFHGSISQAYKQLGNAVVPPVIADIAAEIASVLQPFRKAKQ